MRAFRPAVCIVFLLLTGCGFNQRAIKKSLGTELGSDQAQPIFEALEKREKGIHSYRALSRSRMVYGEDQQTLRHAILFDKPDKLRIEALPLQGAVTLYLAAVNGERAVFLDTFEKIALKGFADRGFLETTTGIPASPQDLMAYVSGSIPAEWLRNRDSLEVYRNDSSGELSIADEDFELISIFDAQTLDLKKIELRGGMRNRLKLSVQFGPYQTVSETRVPSTIEIEIPENNAKFELKLNGIVLNKQNDPDRFEVSVPPDYRLRLR